MSLRRCGTFAIVTLALTSCAGSTALTVQPPAASSLASLVRAPIANSVYPGISAAVGNGTGVLAAEAFGTANLATGAPMTTQTPLRMASISKSITAAAILMLDQAGALSIDLPVATYVPEYTSNGGRISLRQLLAHVSGIPGHAHRDPIIHGDGPITPAQFFAKLNATDLYAVPGTQFDYANENYYLLADVVQNVTHTSYASWVKQHIFEPAGMARSYADEGASDPALALGYVHRSAPDPFIACPAPDWSGELGAGGVVSVPSDIVRFDAALFNGTLLDAAHRKAMVTPVFAPGDGSGVALGWFVLPNGVLQHEGDFTVVAAINAVFPDGTYVVEAANGADLGPDFDRRYFTRAAHALYGTSPIAVGTPSPPSLLGTIGPFSTCAQLDAMVYG